MKVTVIGGGISGLATAFRLQESFARENRELELTVLEAGTRTGGTIHTHVDGDWRVEGGPNGFLDSKPGTLRLVRALGIEGDLLPADLASKKRFLFIGSRLVKLPTSAPGFMFSSLLPVHARLRFMLEPFMGRGPEDETVADFGRRRVGGHAVERLLDPMVSGIFAGDVEKLSVASAFPSVKVLEKEYGSLVRGMMAGARRRKREAKAEGRQAGGPAGPGGHLHSLQGGMIDLIDALTRSLGKAIRTGAAVQSVRKSERGGFIVELAGGEMIEADAVVSAAPAHAAARYLEGLDPEISAELASISYAPIAVIAVGLRQERLNRPLDGFGFLVPSREQDTILGCLWDSSIYPGKRAPEGHVLTRTMVGGARRPELALLPDDQLVALVRERHEHTMGLVWEEPDYLRVSRYELGIPQYPVGHGALVKRVMDGCRRLPGLFVTGNHLAGVGVNDCAADAEATAAALGEQSLRRAA